MLAQDGERNSPVVRETREQPYVAISHVWSHGLGNAKENSLPWCQVLKLFDVVRRYVNPSFGLWVDTLTVPIVAAY